MNRELLLDVRKRYLFLRLANPGHELLKYFCFDQEKSRFWLNEHDDIVSEFIDRFRGDSLSAEEYIKIKKQVSFEDYFKELSDSLFSNYKLSLDREINRLKGVN